MSGLLTGVVVVLVVCHTPKTFLNIQVNITHQTSTAYALAELLRKNEGGESSGGFIRCDRYLFLNWVNIS